MNELLVAVAAPTASARTVLSALRDWATASLIREIAWAELGGPLEPVALGGEEVAQPLRELMAGHAAVQLAIVVAVSEGDQWSDSWEQEAQRWHDEFVRVRTITDAIPRTRVVLVSSVDGAVPSNVFETDPWRRVAVLGEDRDPAGNDQLPPGGDVGLVAAHSLVCIEEHWTASPEPSLMPALDDPTEVIAVRAVSRTIDFAYLTDHVGARLLRPRSWPPPIGTVDLGDDLGVVLPGTGERLDDVLVDRFYGANPKLRKSEPLDDLTITPGAVGIIAAIRLWWRALVDVLRRTPSELLERALGTAYDAVSARTGEFTGARTRRYGESGEDIVSGGEEQGEQRLGRLRQLSSPGEAWQGLTSLMLGIVDGSSLPYGLDDLMQRNGKRVVVTDPMKLAPDPFGVHGRHFCDPLGLGSTAMPTVADGPGDDPDPTEQSPDGESALGKGSRSKRLRRVAGWTGIAAVVAAAVVLWTQGDEDRWIGAGLIVSLAVLMAWGRFSRSGQPETAGHDEKNRADLQTEKSGANPAHAHSTEELVRSNDPLLWKVAERLSSEIRSLETEATDGMADSSNLETVIEDLEQNREREKRSLLATSLSTLVLGGLFVVVAIATGAFLLIGLIAGGAWLFGMLRSVFASARRQVAFEMRVRREAAALKDLTDLEDLRARYIEFLEWAEILGILIHRPFFPSEDDSLSTTASLEGIAAPVAMAVGRAVVTPEYLDDLHLRFLPRTYPLGWLTEICADAVEATKIRLADVIGMQDSSGVDPYARDAESAKLPRSRLLEAIRRGDGRSMDVLENASELLEAMAGARTEQLCTGVTLEWPQQGPDELAPIGVMAGALDDLSRIAERVRSAVIQVVAEDGSGSGVVITGSGLALTNQHVTAGAAEVRVRLSSGMICDAVVLAESDKADLALLSLAPVDGAVEDFEYRPLADPTVPRVGLPIFTLGYPLALEGDATLSAGIISALNRTAEVDNARLPVQQVTQHSAATAPGASGSGVFDYSGRVVAIHSGGRLRETIHDSYIQIAQPLTLVREFLAGASQRLERPTDAGGEAMAASRSSVADELRRSLAGETEIPVNLANEDIPVATLDEFLSPVVDPSDERKLLFDIRHWSGDAGGDFESVRRYRSRASAPTLTAESGSLRWGSPLRRTLVRLDAAAPCAPSCLRMFGDPAPSAESEYRSSNDDDIYM